MRHKPRLDANHKAVEAALVADGCSVISLAPLGCGIGDLLASKVVRGCKRTVMLEVKDGAKPPSKRALTDEEKAFAASWQGLYAVVTSAEEALGVMNA